MNKKKKEDLIEFVRKGFVHTLRAGTDLIIDLGDLSLDFKATFENVPWFV